MLILKGDRSRSINSNLTKMDTVKRKFLLLLTSPSQPQRAAPPGPCDAFSHVELLYKHCTIVTVKSEACAPKTVPFAFSPLKYKLLALVGLARGYFFMEM